MQTTATAIDAVQISPLLESAHENARRLLRRWAWDVLTETSRSLLRKNTLLRHRANCNEILCRLCRRLSPSLEHDGQRKGAAKSSVVEICVTEEDVQDAYDGTIRLGKRWAEKLEDVGEKDAAAAVKEVCWTGRFLEEASDNGNDHGAEHASSDVSSTPNNKAFGRDGDEDCGGGGVFDRNEDDENEEIILTEATAKDGGDGISTFQDEDGKSSPRDAGQVESLASIGCFDPCNLRRSVPFTGDSNYQVQDSLTEERGQWDYSLPRRIFGSPSTGKMHYPRADIFPPSRMPPLPIGQAFGRPSEVLIPDVMGRSDGSTVDQQQFVKRLIQELDEWGANVGSGTGMDSRWWWPYDWKIIQDAAENNRNRLRLSRLRQARAAGGGTMADLEARDGGDCALDVDGDTIAIEYEVVPRAVALKESSLHSQERMQDDNGDDWKGDDAPAISHGVAVADRAELVSDGGVSSDAGYLPSSPSSPAGVSSGISPNAFLPKTLGFGDGTGVGAVSPTSKVTTSDDAEFDDALPKSIAIHGGTKLRSVIEKKRKRNLPTRRGRGRPRKITPGPPDGEEALLGGVVGRLPSDVTDCRISWGEIVAEMDRVVHHDGDCEGMRLVKEMIHHVDDETDSNGMGLAQGALKDVGAFHWWVQERIDRGAGGASPKCKKGDDDDPDGDGDGESNDDSNSDTENSHEEDEKAKIKAKRRRRRERLGGYSAAEGANDLYPGRRRHFSKVVRVERANGERWMELDMGECLLQLFHESKAGATAKEVERITGVSEGTSKSFQRSKMLYAFRSLEISLFEGESMLNSHKRQFSWTKH